MTETSSKEIPPCLDLCEYCTYITCGDFICDITQDVTIVDWNPSPCVCPKKRSITTDEA